MPIDVSPGNATPRMVRDYRRSQYLPASTDSLLIATMSHGGIAAFTIVANTLYAVPIYVRDGMYVSRLQAEVTTASAGNLRMNLYTDNGSCYPDRRLFTETEITTAGTLGIKFQAADVLLPCGLYWAAIVGSSTPGFRAESNGGGTASGGAYWLGYPSVTDTAQYVGITVAFTYAAMPATFTGGGAYVSAGFPRIQLQMGRQEDE